MNYRHAFHAGSFADVLKHSLLINLIKALQAKDKPFACIDTHAGAGMYDLSTTEAQKTQEHLSGISKLWHQPVQNPVLKEYLSIIDRCQTNTRNNLKNYPGSPWLAAELSRAEDKLLLCELHPNIYQELKQLFHHNKKVAVHNRNGYEGLKALIPPKERRGLVLIDPPFEKTTEFEDIAATLEVAHQRWPQGIYAIWYPIKDIKKVNAFKNNLLKLSFKKILEVEWFLYPEDSPVGLPACGMIIINPPWQIEDSIESLMEELNNYIGISSSSHYKIKWLRSQ